MRAAIIDDEKQAIASLKMELAEVKPKIEIVGTANSVESGLKTVVGDYTRRIVLGHKAQRRIGLRHPQQPQQFWSVQGSIYSGL